MVDRGGSFHFVKGFESRPVGAEIVFSARARYSLGYVTALALCLLVTAVAGIFLSTQNVEMYSVYVDVNPSVELVFNRLNQFMGANCLTMGGKEMVEGLRLGTGPEKVIAEVVKTAFNIGYLREDAESGVLVTVVSKKDKSVEKYKNSILSSIEENRFTDICSVDTCPSDFLARAGELGISPGVLKMLERMAELDETVTIDDIKGMSAKDIFEKLTGMISESGLPKENAGSAQTGAERTRRTSLKQPAPITGRREIKSSGRRKTENFDYFSI